MFGCSLQAVALRSSILDRFDAMCEEMLSRSKHVKHLQSLQEFVSTVQRKGKELLQEFSSLGPSSRAVKDQIEGTAKDLTTRATSWSKEFKALLTEKAEAKLRAIDLEFRRKANKALKALPFPSPEEDVRAAFAQPLALAMQQLEDLWHSHSRLLTRLEPLREELLQGWRDIENAEVTRHKLKVVIAYDGALETFLFPLDATVHAAKEAAMAGFQVDGELQYHLAYHGSMLDDAIPLASLKIPESAFLELVAIPEVRVTAIDGKRHCDTDGCDASGGLDLGVLGRHSVAINGVLEVQGTNSCFRWVCGRRPQ